MLNIDIVGDFFTFRGKWFLQGSTVQMLNLVNQLKSKVNFTLFEIGKNYPLKTMNGIKIYGFPSMKKAIPFLKGEIVHFNNICYFKSTPKITTGTIHTNVFLNKESARKELEKIGPFFNKIFVVNNQYMESLSDKFHNFHLIYNGIDTDIFKYTPPKFNKNAVRILFPNRNEPCKNKAFAIQLIKELNNLYPEHNFTLSMIKGNNDRQYPHINFFTAKKTPKEMHLLYSQHPITIIPSLSESCSLCSLEAMATGSIVFYNSLPSIHDYVNGAGYMISIDNISDWCKQIKYLIDNPQELNQKKKLAHNRILKNFSLEQMSRKYYNVWRNLSRKDGQNE